jgi:hypothetical protein
MGRFLSPDWSAKEEPVPYAKMDNPQSLNLYAYVLNNPLSKNDPDGHDSPIVNDPDALARFDAKFTSMLKAGADFAAAHPQLTNLMVNAAFAIMTKGEGKISAEEPGVELSAPTMKGAQREVMRQEGVPTSQQPASQENTPAGKQYTYEVPKPGGGTETKVVQRNTGTDSSHPGQPHVEGGSPKPGGQTDSIGRPRLQNDKTKVVVKPNGQQ